MGKVVVKIKVTNLIDFMLKQRKLTRTKPRQVEVEAIADTRVSRLYPNRIVIRALGLKMVDSLTIKTSHGAATHAVFDPVWLEVQRRFGDFDVMGIEEKVTSRLGWIPLLHLDFVVDAKSRKLIPNPEHGGQQMTEEY
jgi:hypothetical protein